MNKDIFISYKNDNAGNNFATRLKDDLENHGYSVYFNSDEAGSGHFPERLKEAIRGCKDFVLVVSQGCLSQLMANHKVDWIREEILAAQQHSKHIIPILMSGVEMPKDKDDMPESLRFLPDIDAISMPEQYTRSPFDVLLKTVISKAEKDDIYRDIHNSNSEYNVIKDFEMTLAEAESGDPKAMYEVASMYFYGFTDEKNESNRDFSKAYKWFKKLSEIESDYKLYSMTMLGRMYYDCQIPIEKQSYEKSLQYHRMVADKIPFCYSTGRAAYMLQTGRGCEFDFCEVEKFFLDRLENSDDSFKINLADFYINYGKFKQAVEVFNSMDVVPAVVEYKLGMLYKNGLVSDPPKPDYVQASYHFQNALNGEHIVPEAANQLGLLYFAPTKGFRKNFQMAQHYFLMGAEMGDKDACYMLGYMYEFGYVEKNYQKALHYFSIAESKGDINSSHHLAMIYQQSECKNYHKAFKHAQTSANYGNPEGEFIFANLLFFGRGCEANVEKAYEMYSRAYMHGFDQAKFMMEKIENISN